MKQEAKKEMGEDDNDEFAVPHTFAKGASQNRLAPFTFQCRDRRKDGRQRSRRKWEGTRWWRITQLGTSCKKSRRKAWSTGLLPAGA